MTNKRGHAPVVFDEASFDADTKEGNPAGADVAEAARRAYERDGVPSDDLRRCEAEGSDGTLLPHCLKVYCPPRLDDSAWSSSWKSSTARVGFATWPSASATILTSPTRRPSTKSRISD